MLLSLCMPTNGVVHWVFPVLDSIYSQGVDETLFEVVIADNGDNQEFKNKIKEYIKEHSNLVYAETNTPLFLNEIESYKRASGELIKFVNHRTKLVDGTLQRLVDFARENLADKPVSYFSNGSLKIEKKQHVYGNFDAFVRGLSYWSTWSTGMTIWKSEFEQLPEDISSFNQLYPHTNILFSQRSREKYIIDNSVIFDEIPQGKTPKGSYDLYYAFGVDYPGIIEQLYKDGSISKATLDRVLDENLDFIAELYLSYNIFGDYCSYDLSGLDNMYGKYYSKHRLMAKVIWQLLGIIKIRAIRKIKTAIRNTIIK